MYDLQQNAETADGCWLDEDESRVFLNVLEFIDEVTHMKELIAVGNTQTENR